MAAPMPSFPKMRCWLAVLLCLLFFFLVGVVKQMLAAS